MGFANHGGMWSDLVLLPVANAVIDGLKHLGVKHIDMPMTPERVWRAMNPS